MQNYIVNIDLHVCGLSNAKENHHNTRNTVQDLSVFVSNQETFAIKSCAQPASAFNFRKILLLIVTYQGILSKDVGRLWLAYK